MTQTYRPGRRLPKTAGGLALVLAALAVLPGGAPTPKGPTGTAVVSDGDTLRVAGTKVRLFGIDAPEKSQSCGDWACGAAARARLIELVEGRDVTCVTRDIDKYGRTVATCRAGGDDLNATMVSEGLAWAFTRYSSDYVADEEAARSAHLGIWQASAAEAPWDYRAEVKAERDRLSDAKAEREAGGCLIKGNISADGEKIYHLPGSPGYGRVRVSTAKGERWFCDESAALAAGWRAVRG